jgi:RimJ/RimL family protein N-acetyltransferase
MSEQSSKFRLSWIGPVEMPEFGRFLYEDAKKNPNKVIKPFSKSPNGCAILALKHNDKMVGYMIYKWRSPKVMIYKLFVLEPFRRQGGGTSMLKVLTDTYTGMKAKPVVARVRGTDLAAQKFFSKNSFVGSPDGDDYVFTFMDRPKSNARS